MEEILKKLPRKAQEKYRENHRLFSKIKSRPPRDLDEEMQKIHHAVFSQIDCLSCANCCKTTGPLFTWTDIERIAKYLKLKPQEFIRQYLREDEDKDWVFQQLPCPFLGTDNRCWIYEVRPKACREYPHTDRKKIYRIAPITLKNAEICPAVYRVLEEMKVKWKMK